MSRDVPVLHAGPTHRPAPAGPRSAGILLLIAAGVLWSLAGLAVKWARTDPICFAAVRSFGAALVMLPLLGVGARLTGRGMPGPKVMLGAALAHTVMVAAFISAMTFATAAEGILLQHAAPAYVAAFAWLFLGRPVNRATAVALVVALLGVAAMLAGADHSGGWLGRVLGVVAGFGFAAVILSLDAVESDSIGRTGLPPNVFAVVCVNNLVAAAALGIWAVPRGLFSMPPDLVLKLIALGMVQMAAPYVLFQLGLRRVGPVVASLLALLEPVLNPIWTWLGVGEIPPGSVYVGGSLILFAVAITALFGRRRDADPLPEAPGSTTPPR